MTQTMTAPRQRRATRGFRDLVPWADPYIVSLVETLERGNGRLPRASSKVPGPHSRPRGAVFVDAPSPFVDVPSRVVGAPSRIVDPPSGAGPQRRAWPQSD